MITDYEKKQINESVYFLIRELDSVEKVNYFVDTFRRELDSKTKRVDKELGALQKINWMLMEFERGLGRI